MDTSHNKNPRLVTNGAGQLIVDRRAKLRFAGRHRGDKHAVMSTIKLALLSNRLVRGETGVDPYNARNGHERSDVWGSKRRD